MAALDTRLLAASVAAWHNRHPLSRKIDAEHIGGVGVVALPFFADPLSPTGPTHPAADVHHGSLRQRALTSRQHAPAAIAPQFARPVAATLERAFDEAFIEEIRPRRAAAFAARYGIDVDPSSGQWPRRDVRADSGRAGDASTTWRFLRTAAIETQERRIRVLISATPGNCRVLGPRIYSTPRVATLLTALALLCGAAFRAQMSQHDDDGETAARRTTPDTVALAPGLSSSAAVPEEPRRAASASGQIDVVVEPPASGPAAPESIPLPQLEHQPIDIRPHIDPERARIARQASAAARATAIQAGGEQHSGDSLPIRSADGRMFALVARETRTRAASQVVLALLQSTAQSEGAQGTRSEVVPSKFGFRASWWPFASRQQAEEARQRLATIGLPVEVVEF